MNSSQTSRSRSVQSLIELVQTFADIKLVRSEVERFSKNDIESYQDEQGLDVLHHAIIANNIEVVTLMFFKGYYLPPHEMQTISYMHLAAKLGHRTVLGLLLQDRPHDNKAVIFKYQSASQKHFSKPDDGYDRNVVSPLDVAGRSGHLNCVKLILDHCLGRYQVSRKFTGKDAHINMACQLDSPYALRLLLSQSPTDEDMKSAVEAALRLARPECLDILLRLGPDFSALFKGMNLYHVLYSYSHSFDQKWVEALPAVTAVLIRHGHSVFATVPFRTYPLYSLLSLCVSWYDMPERLPYAIACLVLILNAGADPNFDEVKFEMDHAHLNIMPAFGRLPYSTSLNCLFYNTCCLAPDIDEELKLVLFESIRQCLELLLRHGANPHLSGRRNEDGSLAGTAFHSFCEMTIRFGLDLNSFSLLLKYGVDPDIECNGFYPVDLIFEDFICNKVRNLTFKHLETFLNVTNLMSYDAIKCLMRNTEGYMAQEADTKQTEVKTKILTYLENVFDTWNLKKQCKILILKSCQRKMANVLKLPLPMKLRKEIIEIPLEYFS